MHHLLDMAIAIFEDLADGKAGRSNIETVDEEKCPYRPKRAVFGVRDRAARDLQHRRARRQNHTSCHQETKTLPAGAENIIFR